MASISSSSSAAKTSAKTLTHLKTRTLSHHLFRAHHPSLFLRHVSSSSPESPPDPAGAPTAAAVDETTPEPLPNSEDAKKRSSRARRREPEKLEEIIGHMMAARPWTTRLQNSIRNLVPVFDQPLVLGVIRSARHPEHALRFFRWVEKTGFRHDSSTYSSIVDALTRHRMLNHARCLILEDMPKRDLAPNEPMLADLIAAYGLAAIPQEAVKLFRRAPDLLPASPPRTHLLYDAVFKAILRRGRVLMAKRIFNSMLRDGVAPQLSTYNALLWGFCLCAKMDTATRFFADMKERGIIPDIITYNTLLNGWVRAKKIEDAEKAFAEMASAGLGPNEISYNLMIKGYLSVDRVDDGLRLFEEMRSKGLWRSERTFAALMPMLCDNTERTADAKKVFDEMAERRITPKDDNKSIFFRLISSMCQAGNLAGALEVHRKMDRFRVIVGPAHYGILIGSLCNGGKYDKAIGMLDELLEKGALLAPQASPLDASAYIPMIEHLCSDGHTKKAEDFFRQLMKKGVDDKIAFNHLIRGYAKEGSPESAFELLGIMSRHGVETKADAYTLLVESFLKKGEPADARMALDSMMEQGHVPSSSLFRSVMVALFDDGRVQTASRVMKSMIEKGVKENMDMVQKILEALLMRGHVEEALGRIDLMMMNDCTHNLDSLLVALCDNDKAIAALKLVDFGLERDCDISFACYDRVLDVLCSAGKHLPAYSVLCKIKAKGGVVDKKGCEALVKSLNAEGHTKQADILSRILSGKVAPVKGMRASKVAVGV